MYRIWLCVFFALLLPAFQGCGVFDSLKGDSGDKTGSEVNRSQVQKDMDRLKAENIDLKQQIAYMKKVSKQSLEESQQELEKMNDARKALEKEVRSLREAPHRITLENSQLKQQPQVSRNVASRGLKIKVLSGDGDLNSARVMQKKLEGMAYEIGAIGHAPRSNFNKNTVYFKPQFEKEGEHLLSELGDNAVMRPLTWPSIFDIIIVTGKNP